MADLRTKNILVSAAALVVPAIGFTIILVASIWRGPDESESMIGFVAQTIGLMMPFRPGVVSGRCALPQRDPLVEDEPRQGRFAPDRLTRGASTQKF